MKMNHAKLLDKCATAIYGPYWQWGAPMMVYARAQIAQNVMDIVCEEAISHLNVLNSEPKKIAA